MNAPKEDARRAFLQALQVAAESLVELEDGRFGVVLARVRMLHELVSDAVAHVRRVIESRTEPGGRQS